MREAYATQEATGVSSAFLERDAIARRFPWLTTADLTCATLGLADEGWFDGYSLTQAFRRKAIELGVQFLTEEVTGFSIHDGQVQTIHLGGGSHISAGQVVNAAGPWAGGVAALAGLDLPVERRCRSVFVVDCPTARPDWPLVIDPSGIYFRPEGGVFLVGAPAPPDCAHAEELEVDHEVFEEMVWPTLAARAPAFETLRLQSSWAGFYEMNVRDKNAIIGRAPSLPNFWLINGFSGHGMQHAPAAGRGLAELMLFGEYRSLDLTPLGMERLLNGQDRRPERNVI
jgi:glycine/D-amino acid oxidase-like deaminating enzyme